MRSYRWTSILAIAVGLSGPVPSVATAGQAGVTGAPLDAIWRVQAFDFHFRAADTYHSCSSLHDKISGILTAVGASGVIVQLSCGNGQLTNEAFARVVASAPMDASPENIAAATTYDSRQELLARVRDIRLPTAQDIERFPAEWRTVSLTRVGGVLLGAADCELLRELNEQIFPQLSIRVVRKRLSCSSQGVFNSSRPVLVVEALVRRDA